MMTRSFTDQMHRTVKVNYPPKRIISLVPSQTELLYDLGLNEEIVGQTLFCIHPEVAHQTKPRVGGTKKLNMEAIAALKPDLIIGNKEENEQFQIEELSKIYPVWMSDITNLQDAVEMIEQVGELVDRKEASLKLAQNIRNEFSALKPLQPPLRTAYFIWREPWMAAGKQTFIDDMMQRCGYVNVFAAEESRYPEISHIQLQASHIQLILLSSEPYPFKEKHVHELKHYCPHAEIKLVDGEMFSWYGSRLVKAVEYLGNVITAVKIT